MTRWARWGARLWRGARRLCRTRGRKPRRRWIWPRWKTGHGEMDFRHLLRGAEVWPWLMREMERLQITLSAEVGAAATLADGGVPVKDIAAAYPEANWDAVCGEMFLEPLGGCDRPSPCVVCHCLAEARRRQTTKGDRLSHSLQRPRVRHGGKIAERLPDVLATDEAAHNFPALRFGKLGHYDHFARPESGTERFHHGAADRRAIHHYAWLGDGIADDGFALGVVGHADDGGFGNAGVQHHGLFHFRGTHLAAGHVHGFIGATVQEPVAVFIHAGPIAVIPHAGEPRPVGVDVALRVVPDAARHGRRRARADQVAFAGTHGSAVFIHHFGGHAGRGAAERAGLERLNGKREEEASDGFSAAGNIDDGTAAVAHAFEEPEPGSFVPGLAGGTEQAQRGHGRRVSRGLAQDADGGGGDAEGRDAVALDHFPKAQGAGEIGRAIIHEDSAAE